MDVKLMFLKMFTKPKIKGNVKSNGEKIYHVEDGSLYDSVVPEKMFYTEKQALKEGFRKSKK